MICTECHADKDVSSFYVDRSRSRGRVARCRMCYSERQKQDRLQPSRRFSEFKSNAVKRGIEWHMTMREYLAWIWGASCYFCTEPANGGMDRINNENFYSIQNVIACCGRCNGMKSNDTLHQFLSRLATINNNLNPATM